MADGTGGAPGGAPEGGAPAAPPASGGTPAVAPWSQTQGPWAIGEKPWFETIQEQPVRELMAQKQYANPAVLATAYYNANKMLSGDTRVEIPAEDAKPEAWNQFYTKLGRPEAPEKYDFNIKDADPGVTEFGRKLFYELGVPAKKAQRGAEMYQEWMGEHYKAQAKATSEANDKQIADVRTRWGGKADEYISSAQQAFKVMSQGDNPILSPAAVDALERHIGAGPVVELMAAIGARLGEGGFKQGGSGGPVDPASMSPQQAEKAIAALQADTKFMEAYNGKHHPQHKEATDKMLALFAARSATRAA